MPKPNFPVSAAVCESAHSTIQDAILSNAPLFALAVRRGLEILETKALASDTEHRKRTVELPIVPEGGENVA